MLFKQLTQLISRTTTRSDSWGLQKKIYFLASQHQQSVQVKLQMFNSFYAFKTHLCVLKTEQESKMHQKCRDKSLSIRNIQLDCYFFSKSTSVPVNDNPSPLKFPTLLFLIGQAKACEGLFFVRHCRILILFISKTAIFRTESTG